MKKMSLITCSFLLLCVISVLVLIFPSTAASASAPTQTNFYISGFDGATISVYNGQGEQIMYTADSIPQSQYIEPNTELKIIWQVNNSIEHTILVNDEKYIGSKTEIALRMPKDGTIYEFELINNAEVDSKIKLNTSSMTVVDEKNAIFSLDKKPSKLDGTITLSSRIISISYKLSQDNIAIASGELPAQSSFDIPTPPLSSGANDLQIVVLTTNGKQYKKTFTLVNLYDSDDGDLTEIELTVSDNDILIGTDKLVTFWAEIDDGDATVLELKDENKNTIGYLYDNAIGSDDLADDNVFTGAFTLRSSTQKLVCYTAVAPNGIKSNELEMNFYRHLTDKEHADISGISATIEAIESKYSPTGNEEKDIDLLNEMFDEVTAAFDKLVEEGIVLSYEKSEGGIIAKLYCGVSYGYFLNISKLFPGEPDDALGDIILNLTDDVGKPTALLAVTIIPIVGAVFL